MKWFIKSLPKCSIKSSTLTLPNSLDRFDPYLNIGRSSSAGSTLVESSNCKDFYTQQGHCDRYNACHTPEPGYIPLHQGCCQSMLVLLNVIIGIPWEQVWSTALHMYVGQIKIWSRVSPLLHCAKYATKREQSCRSEVLKQVYRGGLKFFTNSL